MISSQPLKFYCIIICIIYSKCYWLKLMALIIITGLLRAISTIFYLTMDEIIKERLSDLIIVIVWQFQILMEKQKSKIHDILKKMSYESFRTVKQSPVETPNPYSFCSPKRSGPSTPLKSSMKSNFGNERNQSASRKYALNKTAYGTSHQKSTLLSYISTPNENSMSTNKLKKFKSNRNITCKTKDMIQSTEDENLSEQSVKVEYYLGKKKLGEKRFYDFEAVENIRNQMVQLLKGERSNLESCYGMIGLDPIPYNHGLRTILNTKQTLVQHFIDKKITEIIVQPILVEHKPNFENIELSNFELLKHLGSGGFSNVYLAKCNIDQKICALKFIKKDSITSSKKAKMLQNQKQILFTIDSPDLVDLLYSFETNNYIVFGLQYCENGNLYNFLQKQKRVLECDAKFIFREILEGLEYLHNNNILFRDLKLENILFDEKGKLKITDFGLSKPEVSEEDITYSYCGSPQYMAPQMLAKCGHSFKVDYYALGILLYELLYGISPFYAPKKEDIFMAILHSEPRFPKQPLVSKEVKDLIKGLLAKDPVHRIGSLKGIKQIKSHPWLRVQKVQKSEALNFPYQNLKISSKQIKEIRESFKIDLSQKCLKKFFFPKSFVNKKIIEELNEALVVFPTKKDRREKMIKSSSRNKQSTK